MKVHLIRKESINDFLEKYSTSEAGFSEWLEKLRYADWDEPGDIKKTFGSADLLGKGSNRVIFDIGGNKFRLIGKYAFGETQVHLFVKWIGTHADYSKLCAKESQYTVSKY